MTFRRWATLVVLLATLALAVTAIVWADADFVRRNPPDDFRGNGSRPEWIWAMNRPYRRLQNAWIWVALSVTTGMAARVALDGRWRRPLPSGSILVLVTFAVGVFSAGTLLVSPTGFWRNGIGSSLHDQLAFEVPGAVIGAWAVTWGRKVDWRGKLVTGVWLIEPGLLILYGVIFG